MLRSKLSSLREYLTPINHNSNFATTGEISPQEFVTAGDYLVYKFPTWEWGLAPEKLQKSFLPPDKQFLVTRHVPSYQRAAATLGAKAEFDEDEEELEEGWIKSHRLRRDESVEARREREEGAEAEEEAAATAAAAAGAADINDIDDLIDNDAEDDSQEEGDFEDLAGTSGNPHLRRYDLYITYSTSYRVPKMYLFGFNSGGIPLSPNQMFEDISADYREKTTTIEKLPVSHNTTSVSIHPCKHASVMKVLMAHAAVRKRESRDNHEQQHASNQSLGQHVEHPNTTEAAEAPDISNAPEAPAVRVDQYLIIFLKFIASVTPGIEYDYTMEAL